MKEAALKSDLDIRERIMVIDDERRICESLSALLTGAGYEVTSFQDSAEAAQEIRTAHFDLILSDIKMPGLSGLEVCRMLKREYACPAGRNGV